MSEHTITELSALTGLPVRTIRYYLSQGLIPSADKEGPSTRYPDATLARLRLIAKLRDAHLPLAEIRKRLDALTDREVLELAGAQEEPAPAGSALDYVRSLLEGGGQPPAAASPAMTPPMTRAPLEPSPLARRIEQPLRMTKSIGIESLRLLDADVAPPGPVPPPADRPSLGQRSQWEHIAITSDIELHVRRPLSRRDNRIVERLIAFARQLQGEDKP